MRPLYGDRIPEPPQETPTTSDFMAAHIELLKAENAELLERYMHIAELNYNQVDMVRASRLQADNACRWERCFRISFGLKNKYRRELTAANDMLDALREALPEYEGDWQDWEPGDLHRLASAIHRILYSDSGAPETPGAMG